MYPWINPQLGTVQPIPSAVSTGYPTPQPLHSPQKSRHWWCAEAVENPSLPFVLHTINQAAMPHLVLLTFIVEDFSAIQRTQVPLQGLVQVVAPGSSQDSPPLQELRSKSSYLTGGRLLRPSLKEASGGPSPPAQTHPNISGPTYT